MLRQAFNALTKMHSRDAQIRRPGTPDTYSPCRITPSNYFQFKAGPEYTEIHAREFVISSDSLLGDFSQEILFVAAPDEGSFKLQYGSNTTAALAFDATPAQIQTALHLLDGLRNVTVSGTIADGLIVKFSGFSVIPSLLLPVDHSTLLDVADEAVEITVAHTYQAWNTLVKRGDKIIDSVYTSLSVRDIIEIPDLGGSIMGYRVRAE